MSAGGYVIRVRFAGALPAHVEHLASEEAVYLGARGGWASLDKAMKFRSFRATEDALNEKWHSLRLSGDRSTILTISRLTNIES